MFVFVVNREEVELSASRHPVRDLTRSTTLRATGTFKQPTPPPLIPKEDKALGVVFHNGHHLICPEAGR